jgi:hypothetical protein
MPTLKTPKKKPKSSVKPSVKPKKDGFNLAPLISAVLLAGIKLSLEQKKLQINAKRPRPRPC